MQSKYKVRVLLLTLFVFGLVLGCKKDDKAKEDQASSKPPLNFPLFSSAAFEAKVPDLLYYKGPSPSPLVLKNQAQQLLPAFLLTELSLAQESAGGEEDEIGCKVGQTLFGKINDATLKVFVAENAEFAVCGVRDMSAYMAKASTALGGFINDGKKHFVAYDSYMESYVYQTNLQDGGLSYKRLRFFDATGAWTELLWSEVPKRFIQSSMDYARRGAINYIESFQQGDAIYASRFAGDLILSVESESTWSQISYDPASGAYKALQAYENIDEKDATIKRAMFVRGNVKKQLAGARLQYIYDKAETSEGALFGTPVSSEAAAKLAAAKNISDSTLDVLNPSKFLNSDHSFKDATDLAEVLLERFKALKTVPAMKGSFYE